ncbi:MAG: hypothetical protein WCG23_09810 [bacterium]
MINPLQKNYGNSSRLSFAAVFVKVPVPLKDARGVINKIAESLDSGKLNYIMTENLTGHTHNVWKMKEFKNSSSDGSNDAKLVEELTKQGLDAWV